MNILIRHESKGRLQPEVLEEIHNISEKFGSVAEESWGARSGAIDLVSIIEIIVGVVGMKALDGFVEGLVGKDWFKELGKKTQTVVSSALSEFSQYFSELFRRVIRKNKERLGAIVAIEQIQDIKLYVVLNHDMMTESLIASLPFAIAVVARLLLLDKISVEHPKVVQLYPNFETWDYLFVPSTRAFGNFVDRYVDLRDGKDHVVKSPEEFTQKFVRSDRDIFKFLISPRRNFDSAGFNEEVQRSYQRLPLVLSNVIFFLVYC
jgi:hypothetical protein